LGKLSIRQETLEIDRVALTEISVAVVEERVGLYEGDPH
jgi:hypothetical protein